MSRAEAEPAPDGVQSTNPGAGGPPIQDDLPRQPPGAGSPGASRAHFVRKLAEHDKQLAGYLMGRRVDGREIEGGELARLRGANDVLQESRAALHIGRGNVTTDIAATGGHSARTYAAARVVRNNRKLNEFPLHRAAIAEIAGAGNCGEHAAVTVHKLAARLAEGEQAHSVHNRAADHGWAELRGQTPEGEPQPAIVLDAWGEGPAIHAEDAVFASPAIQAELKVSDYSYDAQAAARALEEKTDFLAAHGDAIGDGIDVVRKRLEALNFQQKKVFGPTPVIDPGFAGRVREKMEDAHDMTMFRLDLPALESTDLRNELLATSVLRQLGASVKEATAAAPGVAAAAAALAHTPQNPARTHAALQAQAAEVQRRAPQPLLDLFPAVPVSGGREREPDAEAGDEARNVRQRV